MKNNRAPKVKSSFKLNSSEWAFEPVWAPVSSSNIKAIRYDRLHKFLYVRFLKQNRLYVYYDVSQRMAESLFNAPSIGKYFYRYIRLKKKYLEI